MTEANEAKLEADIARALDSEPGPSPRAEREVFARIAARNAVPAQRGTPGRFIHWLLAPTPRWAQAVLIAVIVVQAGLLVRDHRTPPLPEMTSRGMPMQATRLRIVFNPTASEAQIRALLETLHARMADGPDANGRYVIELTAADPNAVAGTLQIARARQDIVLALELAPP